MSIRKALWADNDARVWIDTAQPLPGGTMPVIRPFDAGDYAACVAIDNAVHPDNPQTVEEWTFMTFE